MSTRRLVGILAVTMCFASAVDAQPSSDVQTATVYRVKVAGGGLGVFVDQTVVFQEVTQGRERFWVLEQRRHDQRLSERTFRHQWIDGRTCPGLANVLAGIGALPSMSFATVGAGSSGWVSDIPYVTLSGPPAGGMLGETVMRVDLNGPVSHWWWRSEELLASCWRDAPVVVNGSAIPEKLGDDEAARAAVRH